MRYDAAFDNVITKAVKNRQYVWETAGKALKKR